MGDLHPRSPNNSWSALRSSCSQIPKSLHRALQHYSLNDESTLVLNIERDQYGACIMRERDLEWLGLHYDGIVEELSFVVILIVIERSNKLLMKKRELKIKD